MKFITIVLLVGLVICKPGISKAQTLNWGNLKKDQRHIISATTGLDYGVIFGAGYSYRLQSRLPVFLHTEYSFPGGAKLFDDFKTKTGGQIKLYQTGNVHLSAGLSGVFRRFENDFARLLNFGTELNATAGYYKHKWFVAAETGFDKAIVTHFRHSASYKALYPQVKDGWYEPASGGNFYYGLQTGYSFRRTDMYLKAGKVIEQDFKTSPLIPFSVQLGAAWKIRY